MGADPLGGASVHYWEPIKAVYGLDITVVNSTVDPTFSFMTLDHDGKIRMDCSSPYAMASLVKLKDQFDIAFANDTDADRHGIVTRSLGLMNPNHYLAVAIHYLLTHRPQWSRQGRCRQDPRQQWPHRPGRGSARPHLVRSAGWFQVVCRRALRRLVLFWRRGKCRSEFPAAGRHVCGRPTRTDPSWTCWQRRSPLVRARILESTTAN